MRITRRCTWISLSAIVSQNRLNPIMQRAKIDRSVRQWGRMWNSNVSVYFEIFEERCDTAMVYYENAHINFEPSVNATQYEKAEIDIEWSGVFSLTSH